MLPPPESGDLRITRAYTTSSAGYQGVKDSLKVANSEWMGGVVTNRAIGLDARGYGSGRESDASRHR
jgi:hypothetical protein